MRVKRMLDELNTTTAFPADIMESNKDWNTEYRQKIYDLIKELLPSNNAT